MPEIREITVLIELEGLTIEEAKLTYAERQNLPSSAFCGPDRTYPAHDAKRVRNAFARLSKFGKKMPKSVALKIYRCIVRRAKKFNVEHDTSKFKWLTGHKTVQEAFDEMEERDAMLLEFLDEELEEYAICNCPIEETARKLWIQKAISKKGALRKQLGIKKGEKVPISILRRIVDTETGKTVSFRGKTIRVTIQLKRRALLALRLIKMPKRGK